MKTKMSKKQFFGLVALAMACVLVGTGIGWAGTSNATAQESATKLEGVVTSPFTQAVSLVHNSVVGVNNYKTYQSSGYGYNFGFGNNGRGNDAGEKREVLSATGSGTVVSGQGHVLTNYHVIEGATKVSIIANGKEYDAEVIVFDADLDIAVLRAADLNLTPVALGNSDNLTIGDWAIVIGNPLSDTLAGTTTAGIVSGLNRSISTGTNFDKYGRMTETTNTMIQVDASINSGNSGGGMFNVLGELVGIPTIKYSSSGYYSSASIEGIGMCIPINTAKPLIERALSGEVTSADQSGASDKEENNVSGSTQTTAPTPRMGITFRSINGASFNQILPSGAYIAEVEAGTPAAQAGLQIADIIVEADGTLVGNISSDLQSLIASHKEGDIVNLTVYRVNGLKEVMDRYFNNESVSYSDLPNDGEYVDIQVTLKILDEVKQQ